MAVRFNNNNKDTQDWTLIDIAVSADQNIIRTEEDLPFEIRRIHGASKVSVIPIVVGALGSISKRANSPWARATQMYQFEGPTESGTD